MTTLAAFLVDFKLSDQLRFKVIKSWRMLLAIKKEANSPIRSAGLSGLKKLQAHLRYLSLALILG